MNNLELQAVRLFGITTDIFEAGFILQDGTMLNFSDKENGGPSGQRNQDHRETAIFYPNAETATHGMMQFVKDTKAIRVGFDAYQNSGLVDIILEQSLTKKQQQTLITALRHVKTVYIDYYENYQDTAPCKVCTLLYPGIRNIQKALLSHHD